MASSTPHLGERVALARHNAARCGSQPEERRLLVLTSYVEQFELSQLDGPSNSLHLAKALCNWLPKLSPRCEVLEDAVSALLGTHDAWKVFERIACPLATSAKGTGLGDITEQQFTDVVQGDDSKYLYAAGLGLELQILLADFARILWDSELLEKPEEIIEEPAPEEPEAETTDETQENATSEGDS